MGSVRASGNRARLRKVAGHQHLKLLRSTMAQLVVKAKDLDGTESRRVNAMTGISTEKKIDWFPLIKLCESRSPSRSVALHRALSTLTPENALISDTHSAKIGGRE